MSNYSQLHAAERAGPESAWRSFLSRFLLTYALGLVLIGTLNYVVNPEGLYSTDLVPQVMWNTRPLKTTLLKNMQPPPEALILGSSRVMNLSPDELERVSRLRTFNAGVDLARTEDFYAMLRYAVEDANVRPKLLVLGCDVDMFHNQAPSNAYLRRPSLLSSFLQHNEATYWRWHNFTELFSYDQTKVSLITLAKLTRRNRFKFWDISGNGYARFIDWERRRSAGKMDVHQEISSHISRYGGRFDSFTQVSQERLAYFVATLQYAREHGIEVVVFLTPIHPELERALQAHGYDQRKREVTAAVSEVCARWNVPFHDFSSPASFGGDPSHFYDGRHYDETLAPLLFSRMLPLRAHAIQ